MYELRFSAQGELLASGIFSNVSRLADRIEALLSRGREFTAHVSAARVGAICTALIALTAAASLSPHWIAIAQSPRAAFDVASIKRRTSDGTGVTFAAMPGGRLTVVNNAMSNVINNAYGIAPYQLVGAPDWIRSERYDIEAKGRETASQKEIMLMVQTLLAERLAMKAHFETREMGAYILTLAKDGSKIRILNPEDCVAFDTADPNGQAISNRCGNNLTSRDNVWRLTHNSMPAVTGALSRILGGPVIDRTGIKGTFDFELRWSDDLVAANNLDAPPSLPTALRETLGLELKSGRGPVNVLVIDHIERPSAN